MSEQARPSAWLKTWPDGGWRDVFLHGGRGGEPLYTEAAAREKFAQELEAVGTSAGAWAARYLRSLHTTEGTR